MKNNGGARLNLGLVAASVVNQYPPATAPAANEYLNPLGQTLAQVSSRSEAIAGSRFLMFDSDEVNAFAAPRGFNFRDADTEAIRILIRVGYDPGGLVRLLRAMEAGYVPNGPGLARTHPPPADRLRDVAPLVGPARPAFGGADRQARFYTALRKHLARRARMRKFWEGAALGIAQSVLDESKHPVEVFSNHVHELA